MGRFSELMAEEKKRRFSELLAQEQAGSTDPDVPVARPAKQPAVQTKLASAPFADRLKLGLKANPQDRLKGAQELYPDSMVEQIKDGSVVVRRPTGEVYNFEEPNLGQALTGIARRVVGLDSEIRGAENPTTARALDENASAALPELVLRGVPSAAAAALTGGAGLLPHVLTQAATGAASEIPRAGINAVTAGGESRSSAEIREDAQREGLLAGAGTAILGLAAKPFRSAADSIAARFGSKGAAARDITKQLGGTSEGSPQLRQALDDVDNLGVPRDKAPLSIVERANPKAGPRLKEIYSDPKVADEAAFLEREGQDAVRAAGEGRIREVTRGAQENIMEAENKLLSARQSARNEGIDSKNIYAQKRAQANQAHNDIIAETRSRNTAAKNEYQTEVDKLREGYQKLRLERSNRQVQNRNEYTQAREDQIGAIEQARRGRNQAIQEIRKSDDVLDQALETAKPREIRRILEGNMAPDDPRLADLNTAWTELDMARQPVPKPRLEPIPAPPSRPVRPKLETAPTKKVLPPRQIPKTPEVDAAGQKLLSARHQLRLTKTGPEITQAENTMRAAKESGRRVKPNKPKEMLLSAPARLGVRTAVGLGTAGLSEIPGLAAKFARFARGDKIGRKLITSPDVKNEVLRMLADGIPEKEISAWLVSAAAQASENIE